MFRTRKTQRWERRNRRGTAALEFGMWFMPLMLILSGIIDLGWYMSLRENVMRAARDAARAGAAQFADPDTAEDDVEDAAEAAGQNVLDDIGYTCPNAVTVTQPGVTIDGNDFANLVVEVECDFEPLIGLVPVLSNAPAFTHVTARFVMLSELQ